MKIICTQENLKNGLQIVSRVISSSNTLPILNNLLLKTENGQLSLAATNLEIAIRTTIRCKIEVEGSVCLPAKILNDLVSSLPNQNITVEVTAQGVQLKTDHYSTKINSLPSEDFPLIPTVEQQVELTIPAPTLKQSLDQVMFAASTSETQPELSGVLVRQQAQGLVFVATDRYRLAEKMLPMQTSAGERDIILPHKAVIELSRIMANYSESIAVLFNENQILVRVGDTEIISRLIDGQYPDYKQIIPETAVTTVITKKSELAGALKTGAIFSHTTNSVALEYNAENNSLKLSAASHDLGEADIEIPSTVTGPAGKILLNHRYVLDALNVISDDEIIIKIVNDSAPVVFNPGNDKNYLYLVMPIKI